MKLPLILCLIVVALCAGFIVPERVTKRADKVIAKFYDISDFSKQYIYIPQDANKFTISEFGEQNLFKIISDELLLGYGYIGNAPSKTSNFDYLVLFDQDFIITKSAVLIYREEYGGEISSKRWLRQFIGKSYSSEKLIYNQNIIPISGATISVRSMTKSINELLGSITTLNELKML